MFDFFKKKPVEVTHPNAPPSAEPTTEAVPASESAPVVTENLVAEKPIVEKIKVEEKLSFSERLKQGLSKTRQQLGSQLNSLFGGGKIDADTYEELETILLTSDIGVAATQRLLDNLKKRVKRENLEDTSALKQALKAELLAVLAPLEKPLQTNTHAPFVIMLAGVNGAGKTTTIGKLAKLFQAQGNSVLIAAGDTFRAAAREQLQVWGERNNVTVIASEGGDPAAVIFDAVNSAIAKKIDILIADTAGRL
ncbi:MAG TPA: signaling recognition particle receptor family protein, partial [Methylotenera sp.]|nr:signaling recognition particle receptor family protein [Methylotenera sp.]